MVSPYFVLRKLPLRLPLSLNSCILRQPKRTLGEASDFIGGRRENNGSGFPEQITRQASSSSADTGPVPITRNAHYGRAACKLAFPSSIWRGGAAASLPSLELVVQPLPASNLYTYRNAGTLNLPTSPSSSSFHILRICKHFIVGTGRLRAIQYQFTYKMPASICSSQRYSHLTN